MNKITRCQNCYWCDKCDNECKNEDLCDDYTPLTDECVESCDIYTYNQSLEYRQKVYQTQVDEQNF